MIFGSARCTAKRVTAIRCSSRGYAFALLLIFYAPLVVAQNEIACPGEQGERLPVPEKILELEPLLTSAESRCNNNPLYLAYRGAWFLQTGEAERAAVFLERAIMLRPELYGAQLDYAQALAMTGDVASAEGLFRQLLGDSALPDGLRQIVSSGYQAIRKKPQGPAWTFTAALSARRGYDSNLNGAPLADRLTLTLPDGDAILALGDGYRPRSGAASIIDVRLNAIRDWRGVGQLRLSTNFNAREAKFSSYNQYEIGATWHQRGWRDGQLSAGWQTTSMRYEGQKLLEGHRIQISHDWPLPTERACRIRGGLEGEVRNYPSSPTLNGYYRGAASYLGCALGPGVVGVHVRTGLDRARDAVRPGADQRRHEVRLQGIMQLGKSRLEAESGAIRQLDSSGYSPLLSGGAVRWQERQFARMEWSYPAARSLELFVAADHTRQRSNLALFENRTSSMWLGMRVSSQW
jgi:tetratricopeptide (TPR) repeat protein